MKTTIRPRIDLYVRRSFSEKLSATFDFISENIRPLFRYLSAFLLPLCIVGGVCYTTLMGQISSEASHASSDISFLVGLGTNYLLLMAVSLFAAALLTGVVYTLMQQYWARPNRLDGISYTEMKPQLWHNVRRSAGALVLVGIISLVVFVAAFVGSGMLIAATDGSLQIGASILVVLLFVALAVLFIPCTLILPSYLLTADALWPSVKRAVRLGFRVWGGLLGMLIVLYMVVTLVSYALGIPFMGLTMLSALATIDSSTGSLSFTSSTWFVLVHYLTGVLFLYGMYMAMAVMMVGLGFYYGHAAEKVDGVSMDEAVDKFDALGDGQPSGPAEEDLGLAGDTTPTADAALERDIDQFDKL